MLQTRPDTFCSKLVPCYIWILYSFQKRVIIQDTIFNYYISAVFGFDQPVYYVKEAESVTLNVVRLGCLKNQGSIGNLYSLKQQQQQLQQQQKQRLTPDGRKFTLYFYPLKKLNKYYIFNIKTNHLYITNCCMIIIKQYQRLV